MTASRRALLLVVALLSLPAMAPAAHATMAPSCDLDRLTAGQQTTVTKNIRTNTEPQGGHGASLSADCTIDPKFDDDDDDYQVHVEQHPLHADYEECCGDDDEASFEYYPAAHYTGDDDKYVFHITDPEGNPSPTYTVSFHVADDVDNAPTCYTDPPDEGDAEVVTIRPGEHRVYYATCDDPDGDPITYLPSGPASTVGTVSAAPGDSGTEDQLIFTAASNAPTGHDKSVGFVAQETNGTHLQSNLGHVHADVIPVTQNSPLSCNVLGYGSVDAPIHVAVDGTAGLLNPCYDYERDPLAAPVIGSSSCGVLAYVPGTVDTDGQDYLNFDPAAGTPCAVGATPSVDVTISDHPQLSQTPIRTSTITVHFVVGEATRPTCKNQSVSTPNTTAITITLSCTDPEAGDGLHVAYDTEGLTLGSVTSAGAAYTSGGQRTIVYTPTAGKTGTDVLTFSALDDNGTQSPDATVTITVSAPSDTTPTTSTSSTSGTSTTTASPNASATPPPTAAGPTQEDLVKALEEIVGDAKSDTLAAAAKAILAAVKSGRTSVTVTVGPYDQPVTIEVTLLFGGSARSAHAAKTTKLGAGSAKIAANAKGKVKINLNKVAKKLLKKKKKLSVSLVTKVTAASGVSTTGTKSITLKAKKKHKKKH